MAQISVVIPVYNTAAYLEQCLDSVVGQTFADIEIICVDDGSTDESPEILSRYVAKDKRFRVITQSNAGPGAARNAGLAQAIGQYVIFLDSDDWFESGFLVQMFQCIQKTKADLVICRAVEFDTEDGKDKPSAWMLKEMYLSKDYFRPEEVADHLFQFTYGWPWDKLYRIDFIRSKQLFFPELQNSEDVVFVFQSLALARSIAILDETLVHHRVNRMTSVSNSRGLKLEAPYQAVILLQEVLEQYSIYQTFERSFLNWAMEFLIWNVASIREQKIQKIYFQKLKQEWLPRMGFDVHPSSYYGDNSTYTKYWLVKKFPYSVFSAVLAIYRKGLLKKMIKKIRCEGGVYAG